MRNFLFLVNYLFIISCSNYSSRTNSLEIIDIPEAFETPRNVNLSQFVISIEYVHLEETDQSMLLNPMIEVTDDFIIARNSGLSAMGPILLFDRKTGRFIRKVGKSGRGPGEYQMVNTTFYNIYSKTLYGLSYSHNEILEFDASDNFLGEIKIPIMVDEKVNPKFGTPSIGLDQYLSGDIFVSSITNITGWEKRRIVIYSRDSIIKIYPNFLLWERKNWNILNSVGLRSVFFRWKDKLSFKEESNDTVFQITKSTLIPRFIFKTSGLNPKPGLSEQRVDFDVLASYYLIQDIVENDDYLFFQLHYKKNKYTCFFNKKQKSTIMCKLDENNKSALTDDITDFIPFAPVSLTVNNELVSVYQATEIKKWKTENPDKFAQINSKLPWLIKINEFDNPVILIAKCK